MKKKRCFHQLYKNSCHIHTTIVLNILLFYPPTMLCVVSLFPLMCECICLSRHTALPCHWRHPCVCVFLCVVLVYVNIMLIKRQIVSWYHAELCWKIISSVGNDKSTIVYNSVQQCRFTWILSKLASSPNEANLDNFKFWSEVCVAFKRHYNKRNYCTKW